MQAVFKQFSKELNNERDETSGLSWIKTSLRPNV